MSFEIAPLSDQSYIEFSVVMMNEEYIFEEGKNED